MPSATPFTSGLSASYFTPNTGNANVTGLVAGAKWGGAVGTGVTLTYSFPTASAVWAPTYSSNNEPTGFTAFNAAQAASFRSQLQAWGNVADITFIEVVDSPTLVGDIALQSLPRSRQAMRTDGPIHRLQRRRGATSGLTHPI